MKKGHIITGLIVLSTLGGIFAIYRFYVQPRMDELREHLEEELTLEKKIKQLEKDFYGTNPEFVLRTWRGETEPWAQAVASRSEFFHLGDIPLTVEVPEEKIARFYYRDEFPVRQQALEAEAMESGCQLGNVSFDVPTPDNLQNSAPGREEVGEWLAKFEFGAAVTRMLIRANALDIIEVNIWPPSTRANGNLEVRTTGLSFRMATMKDLVQFLDDLSRDRRFFTVDAIRLTNPQLRIANPTIQVEMILSQARYLEKEEQGESVDAGPGGPGIMGPGGMPGIRLGSLLTRPLRPGASGRGGREEPSWWKKALGWVGL